MIAARPMRPFTPVRSTVVRVDGLATHYLEAGPATSDAVGTVLLLHDGAYGGDATSMVPLMAQLVDKFHVFAPDLLGYGRTAKVIGFSGDSYDFRVAHLNAFCAAVGIQDVHAVGSSYAGSLLLRACAGDAPRLPVATVTSIAGTGGPWRRPSRVADYDGTRDAMRSLLHLFVDPGREDFEDLLSRRHNASLVPGHVQSLRAARIPGVVIPPGRSATSSWPASLADCAIPVLLIRARHDELLEPGWTDHFEHVVPHLTIRDVAGRHLPHLDHPADVAAAVRDLIACSSVEAREFC